MLTPNRAVEGLLSTLYFDRVGLGGNIDELIAGFVPPEDETIVNAGGEAP